MVAARFISTAYTAAKWDVKDPSTFVRFVFFIINGGPELPRLAAKWGSFSGPPPGSRRSNAGIHLRPARLQIFARQIRKLLCSIVPDLVFFLSIPVAPVRHGAVGFIITGGKQGFWGVDPDVKSIAAIIKI